MGIINEYIVFITLALSGILLMLIIPFMFMKVNMKQVDNFICQHMLIITYRIIIIEGIVGAIFKLAGTMYDSKMQQVGLFATIGIVVIQYLTYNFFLYFENLTQDEITEYKLRDYYKKVTPFSLFFIIWMIYCFILSMGVYICAFNFFEKIIPTVTTTFIIFIIDLFLGIELTNRINKFIDKISYKDKRGESENGQKKA